jgi:hypothetical protein
VAVFGCGGAVQLGIPLLGDPQLDGHIRAVDMPVAERLGEKLLHRDRGVRSVLDVLGEGLALVVPRDLQAAAGAQVEPAAPPRAASAADLSRRVPRSDGADRPVWVETMRPMSQGPRRAPPHALSACTCGRRVVTIDRRSKDPHAGGDRVVSA